MLVTPVRQTVLPHSECAAWDQAWLAVQTYARDPFAWASTPGAADASLRAAWTAAEKGTLARWLSGGRNNNAAQS